MSFVKAAELLLYIIFSNFSYDLLGRSPWRAQDPLKPELTTCWVDDRSTYFHVRDYCLEYHPLFSKFDRTYFMDHLLPDEDITFRIDTTKSVSGAHLKKLAQDVVEEIHQKKKSFTHFICIKKSNFNERTSSGLIILKYKDYPFVLKLFIKTPETFVKQSEGLNPVFFYRMGGGINRHLSGFTRVKNAEEIQKKIQEEPKWIERLDTPRKWFWLPKNPRWIELRGKNIGPDESPTTQLPAVYGIIADAIETKRVFSLRRTEDRKMALECVHYLGNRVDAHVDNFMIEKATGKILLVDTEHFPTMVGLKEPFHYDDYSSWYKQLINKCVKDIFGRHKKIRRELQLHPKREIFAC